MCNCDNNFENNNFFDGPILDPLDMFLIDEMNKDDSPYDNDGIIDIDDGLDSLWNDDTDVDVDDTDDYLF